MPDAEEQRNLNAQEELYAVVADLELEMNEPPWTDRVALIIDAKVGYKLDYVFNDTLSRRWAGEIEPTKVLVLRTLADRLEAKHGGSLQDEATKATEVQDSAAFWQQYTGAN